MLLTPHLIRRWLVELGSRQKVGFPMLTSKLFRVYPSHAELRNTKVRGESHDSASRQNYPPILRSVFPPNPCRLSHLWPFLLPSTATQVSGTQQPLGTACLCHGLHLPSASLHPFPCLGGSQLPCFSITHSLSKCKRSQAPGMGQELRAN